MIRNWRSIESTSHCFARFLPFFCLCLSFFVSDFRLCLLRFLFAVFSFQLFSFYIIVDVVVYIRTLSMTTQINVRRKKFKMQMAFFSFLTFRLFFLLIVFACSTWTFYTSKPSSLSITKPPSDTGLFSRVHNKKERKIFRQRSPNKFMYRAASDAIRRVFAEKKSSIEICTWLRYKWVGLHFFTPLFRLFFIFLN